MGNPRPRRGTVSAALACALAQNVAGLHVVPFRTVTNPIHIRGGHIEASAQPGYQMPPPEVAELADAKPIPGVSVQPAERRYCLFMTSSSMLTLEDVSAPVLKLGGARFNPCTLIPHGGGGISSYHTALEVQEIKTGERRIVSGIPANARIEHLTWSPDGSKLAFSLRTSEDSDDSVAMLWLLDVKAAAAAPVLPAQPLNAVLGKPFHWLPDSCGLVVKQPIGTRATEPARVTLPSSPIVKESVGDGTKAAVRTYPDLLASEADAAAFRHYATVQLAELRLADGAKLGTVERARVLGPPAITYALSSSPDGRHLLTMSIEPAELSYAVPWPRFGRLVQVLPLADDAGAGSPPVTLQATAALEAIPIGQDAARPGPRAFEWRPDLPATLIYAEALDDGDPKKDADFRDKLLLLAAPFDGPPEELLRTKSRYSYVEWSADGAALVWTRWYQTRTTSIMFVEPAGESRLYMEYDYSDGYTHPGSPLSEPGPWGRSVLRRHDGGGLLWAGGGESADGARPFLDERSYSDGKFVRRLWRGAVGCYDSLSAVLPAEASAAVAPEAVASGVEVILLTRRQTQTVPPQMLLRAVSAESAAAASADALSDEARADSSTILATLSSPDHPQPSLKGISKTLIRYKRADGVDLSGTLYTPAGYDAATDGPLPTILWAYPREFKSKGSAGQVRGSEHTFTMIRWASPLPFHHLPSPSIASHHLSPRSGAWLRAHIHDDSLGLAPLLAHTRLCGARWIRDANHRCAGIPHAPPILV